MQKESTEYQKRIVRLETELDEKNKMSGRAVRLRQPFLDRRNQYESGDTCPSGVL